MARAYAVTVQCAAACTPFKNSDATYVTCCKQHAATAAAAPKPPIRPAVLKSQLLKPFSTGKLQQDHVTGKIKKTADDTNSTANRNTQKNPYQTLSCAVKMVVTRPRSPGIIPTVESKRIIEWGTEMRDF